MKKIMLASALVLMSANTFAAQGTVQTGGFTGPNTVVIKTVQEALEAKDETPVILTGYIVTALGDEEYQFKDASGTITVEIDNEDWNGVQVTPDTKLVILGGVDADWSNVTVDVNSVQLAE